MIHALLGIFRTGTSSRFFDRTATRISSREPTKSLAAPTVSDEAPFGPNAWAVPVVPKQIPENMTNSRGRIQPPYRRERAVRLEIMSRTIRALKGHGTENDFILIPDLDNNLTLESSFIVAICDRQRGVGADGLIRITPSERKGASDWFMDYRNHDGSLAEMCGNGIRVMARYLVDAGLAKPGQISIDTRDGVKEVTVPLVGDISVAMGEVKTYPSDALVQVGGQEYPATKVDVGNPHAVVFIDSLDDAGPLLTPPEVLPLNEFPTGVNVEFVRVDGEREVSMRVFERGVGETRSCGTGTCAAAFATAERFGLLGPSSWTVNVPGGAVRVDLDSNGHAILTGPAVIVAELVVDLDLR